MHQSIHHLIHTPSSPGSWESLILSQLTLRLWRHPGQLTNPFLGAHTHTLFSHTIRSVGNLEAVFELSKNTHVPHHTRLDGKMATRPSANIVVIFMVVCKIVGNEQLTGKILLSSQPMV